MSSTVRDGAAGHEAGAAPRLPLAEFVALIALMFSMMAFSIDAMLPALPQIADELSPAAPNAVQQIIGIFFLATGIGQLVAGPLSDSLGRKPVILAGMGIYAVGAALAWAAPSLTLILAMRFLQGLGLSAVRTVAVALVRDLHAGRMMARVMSLAMTLFVLVPAIAPLAGQAIMGLFGWRSIFLAFIVFAAVTAAWFALRQDETLPPAGRQPMRRAAYASALARIWAARASVAFTAALAFGFAPLIAMISQIRLIFGDSFDRGESFPYWFAAIAVISGGSSLVNARLVMALGMQSLVMRALTAQLLATVLATGLWFALPEMRFAVFFLWALAVFLTIGFTFGNLNALAMEPLGDIAGMAAALIGAVSTVGSALLVMPVTGLYDGTPLPLMGATACFAALALAAVLVGARARAKAPG